ncbi:MAG TPA: hypothetical protein VLC54_20635 [Anaeromyxobacter sp.]|nr:hypothetical protein [Anaeromyxobacter sp.]
MKRGWAVLGSLVFLVLVPGTVVLLVPWWIRRWQMRPAPSVATVLGGRQVKLGRHGRRGELSRPDPR